MNRNTGDKVRRGRYSRIRSKVMNMGFSKCWREVLLFDWSIKYVCIRKTGEIGLQK